jgi:hypothetical protein
MKHRIDGADHAEALELRSRINTSYQWLIIWFLNVTELHVEQTQLIAPGPGLATLA